MKKSLLLLILGSCCWLASQTPAGKTPPSHPAPSPHQSYPPPMLLPNRAQIDTAMQRNFGYDPSITWNIFDIRPSPIPGLAEVILSLNKQAPVHIYMSTDSQNAIVGNLLPFGPNPFEATREKLKAADGPRRGAAKPAIEIVEFSDLECPFCKAAHPLLEKLMSEFPQVRFTFEQFPLPPTTHPWAVKAAHYADCAARANPEGFWRFLDTVFENQGSIALATADDKLRDYAVSSGLDAEKMAACSATTETSDRVNQSIALGQSLDVNSTPSIFVNGRLLPPLGNNGLNYDQLKALVQFEIEHAGK